MGIILLAIIWNDSGSDKVSNSTGTTEKAIETLNRLYNDDITVKKIPARK